MSGSKKNIQTFKQPSNQDPRARRQSNEPIFKTKNFDRFHQYVMDLIIYLKKILAESEKPKLRRAQQKYRTMDKQQYLQYTLNNLSPYIDQIARHDEIIFMPEYGTKPLNFLVGFDFRVVWKQNLSPEEKRVLFRFLLYLYMQASASLGKNKEKIKEILTMLEMEKKIAQEAVENPNAFDDGEDGLSISEIFGEDSVLLELAQEIGGEINFGEIMQDVLGSQEFQAGTNPMEAIGNLFQNPKMQEKIQQLNTTLSQKVQDKELTEGDLLGSLQQAQENIAKKMAQNPASAPMAHMIKNMNIGQMMEQFKVGAEQATAGHLASEQTSVTNEGDEDPDNQKSQPSPQFSSQPSSQPPPNLGAFMQNMMQNPALQQMMAQMPPPSTSSLPTPSSAEEGELPVENSNQTQLPNPLELLMNPQFSNQMQQMQADPRFQQMMAQMQNQFQGKEDKREPKDD